MERRVFVGSVLAGLIGVKKSTRTSQQTEFSGVITGRALNEKGRPVANAEVCATPPTLDWTGPEPCDRSDSSGNFTIRVWLPATYVITAKKAKDGYPNTFNTFYGPPAVDFPRATIKEDKAQRRVAVSVGPVFGRLIGKIKDAQSGRPIESVSMDLRHANNSANFFQLSRGYPKGRLRLLFPPVPVIFKISATGYQDWWYGPDGSEERAEGLLIETGATRQITILLQPAG